MSDPVWLEPEWRAPPRVRALCTLRPGGVSVAPYDALNLGDHVGDAPAAVDANRRRLREAARLPVEPHWLTQVHGTAVADLDEHVPVTPIADAAVSARAATVCAVMTADCLPVLLAAVDGSAVGVAHAGWRGLAAGVIESTLAALRSKAVAGVAVRAWLGAAIGPGHFEVGDEVRTAFLAHDALAAQAFSRSPAGRWHCDLYALARQRLQVEGVEDISGGNLCTYADATRFYSHRRDVQHRGMASTGRMASLIWLE